MGNNQSSGQGEENGACRSVVGGNADDVHVEQDDVDDEGRECEGTREGQSDG